MDVFAFNKPWVTIMFVAMGAVVIGVGGVVVIVGNMTYQDYLDTLWKFAASVAGLGVAKGLFKMGSTS